MRDDFYRFLISNHCTTVDVVSFKFFYLSRFHHHCYYNYWSHVVYEFDNSIYYQILMDWVGCKL